MSSEIIRKAVTASIWIYEPSRANRVFRILREVGQPKKSNHLRPTYLRTEAVKPPWKFTLCFLANSSGQ
jgi:hypothetical protein